MAVVSGRPASFLAQRLVAAGPAVRLFGAYGLEWIEDGKVQCAPEAEPWRGPIARVVEVARSEFAGEAVGIEDKGCSVTVHWRQAPEARVIAPWTSPAGGRAGRGSLLQPGRMAVEFRPPGRHRQGCGGGATGAGLAAACFAGDDAGDLAAFAGLDRLAVEGTHTCGSRWQTRRRPPSSSRPPIW